MCIGELLEGRVAVVSGMTVILCCSAACATPDSEYQSRSCSLTRAAHGLPAATSKVGVESAFYVYRQRYQE